MIRPPRHPGGRGRIGRVAAALAAAGLAVLLAAPPAAADAVRDRQWHLDALNIAEAHQITKGQGVTVAVIDSRAKISHPDLAGNVLPGKDFIPEVDPTSGRNPAHSAEVAAIIAAHGHGRGGQDGVLGIAPGANVLLARANVDPITTAEAIRWAVDKGADVINLSLGYGPGSFQLEDAIGYAQGRDVVVVAGVGNTPLGHNEVQYPAAYPGVVAVSATDRSGQLSHVSVSGAKVDLAAPGADIQTAGLGGSYEIGTGTSFAAPMVAGAAALIRSRYPDLNAASVVNRLVKTATDKGPTGLDPKYGHGIVNPVRALTADIPPVRKNPLGSLAQPSPAATSAPGTAGGSQGSDGNGGLGAGVLIAVAVGVLVVGAVVVVVIVRSSRRKPAPAGSRGSPSAPPYGPPSGQPYGQPPRPPGPPGPLGPPPGPYGPPRQPGPPPGWPPPPRQR